MSTRSLTAKRPLLFAILTTVALVVALGAAGTALFLTGSETLSPVPVVFTPIAIGLAIWATATRRWGILGFRGFRITRPLAVRIGVPASGLLVIAAVFSGGPAERSALDWLGLLLFVGLVAFVEETIFRSVLLKILAPQGRLRAVIISSLAFAFAHAVNALGGQDLDATIRQIVFAFAFGFLAAVMLLAMSSVWPSIVLHAAFDLIQLGSAHQTPAVVDWIMIALVAGGAAWLWRALPGRLPQTRASSESGQTRASSESSQTLLTSA
jgi:membrane protease YdiL (CAAX protease family)